MRDFDSNKSDVDRILKNLTHHNSTFTEKDIIKAEKGLDDESKNDLRSNIQFVGYGYKDQKRFSTKDLIKTEKQLFESVNQLGQRSNHKIDQSEIDRYLLKFQEPLTDNQRFVINRVAHGTDLSSIDFEYGSDRTHVSRLIGRLYQDQGYVVEGVSLSNIGASNFEKDTGIKSSTVFKKIWEWENGKNQLNKKSMLIVDNANMIGTHQSKKNFRTCRKSGS